MLWPFGVFCWYANLIAAVIRRERDRRDLRPRFMGPWNDKLVADVETLAEALVESEGMVLVDVEYRREHNGRVLRIVVDKDGGVTSDDCTRISSQLGDVLDAKVGPQQPFNMEVSSPGLDRSLTKPRHFVHFEGRQVVIQTRGQVGGKGVFRGTLKGMADGKVLLAEEEQVVSFALDEILKARLDY